MLMCNTGCNSIEASCLSKGKTPYIIICKIHLNLSQSQTYLIIMASSRPFAKLLSHCVCLSWPFLTLQTHCLGMNGVRRLLKDISELCLVSRPRFTTPSTEWIPSDTIYAAFDSLRLCMRDVQHQTCRETWHFRYFWVPV